jgi:putative flippase GtrA
MAQSSIHNKVKTITHGIGKYGTTSVFATSLDFTVFHFVLTYLGTTAVQSTIIGRCCGAIVAFLFHRNWVFKSNSTHRFNVLITRYLSGVLLGMGLNVAGVWLLNTVFELNPWFSRIATAASVWFLVFQYNRQVVFHKGSPIGNEKIIAEQDFSELEDELDDENTEGVMN